MYITNTSNQNSKKCITVCPSDVPYYETGACVVKCTTGSYHVVSGATQSLVCQESCTNYVFNTSNDNSKQCLDTCPDDLPFSDSGKCVARCMSGAYQVFSSLSQTLVCQSSCTLYVFNTTNSNSKQCLSSCPSDSPYSDAGLCSARCTSGNYSNSTGSFVCQDACANYFIVNASNLNSKQCVDSCPQGQTPSNQQCVGGCTTDAPYKEASSCVARCSTGAYEASGSDLICVSSCSGMYITNTSNQNSKKCITVCPSDVPYYETGACVVKCTTGSYHVVSGATQSLVCQESCTNYVFNTSNDNSKQCLDTCPDDLPFSDSGKCVARCMSGAYQVFSSLSQTLVCQSSCTLYVFNTTNSNSKQCLSSCPSDSPYSDAGLCSARCTSGNYSNSTGSFVCQDACANYFIVNASNLNSKQCVDSCPQGQTPSNQQCVGGCTTDAPYKEASSCVARCSTGAYEASGSDLICVSSCSGMYITNTSNQNSKKCITVCPSDVPYYETGACVVKCTTGSYHVVSGATQSLVCQESCTNYVFNTSNDNSKQCLDTCPDDLPFSDSGKCVARCMSGAYQVFSSLSQTLVCQSSCTLYVFNTTNSNSKQCLSSCPSDSPYSDAGLCSARCTSGNYSNSTGSFVCQDACANYFIVNASNLNSKQCVDSCPQGQTPSNQQCTPNDCPADTPYIQLSSCVSRCLTGAYEIRGSNMFCVASCPDMYITNSSNQDSQQCISICPTDYPYYQIGACVIRCKTGYYTFFEQEQQQFRCRDICSYYIINSSNWNSKQCFSKCPDYAPYSNTGSCVARCSSGAYQVFPTQNQILQCQIGCVYYVLNVSNQNSKQCLSTCPDTLIYSDNGLCSSRCSSGAYFNSNNIFTCTSSCQIYFVTNTSNQNSKQCVDSCQQNQILVGKECVITCPSNVPYKENMTCVDRCSTGAYTISNGNLVCVLSCSNMYITNSSNQNSKQCISVCPSDLPYYQDGACVIKCSTGAYNVVNAEQTLVCTDSCMYYVLNVTSWNSKQCVTQCPSAIPYSDSGNCTSRCSSSFYQVVLQSVQQLVCLSSCSQYILNASNQNSKQCLSVCPDTAPYNDFGLCSARCASGMYEIKNNALMCAQSCKTYYITNSSNQNSLQCVYSCNMLLQNKECVQSCYGSQPYKEGTTCLPRCSSGMYMVQANSFICTIACSGMYITNMSNENSKQCISACPPDLPYYSPGACVAVCKFGVDGTNCKASDMNKGTVLIIVLIPVIAVIGVLVIVFILLYQRKHSVQVRSLYGDKVKIIKPKLKYTDVIRPRAIPVRNGVQLIQPGTVEKKKQKRVKKVQDFDINDQNTWFSEFRLVL
ncbi:Conserved_hypothetical protein [Hexamita inflata]|uniref:Uncharacterized protein n=1 Tax=Hexamita inflata TaxID=28002 RepID=A0AA86PFA9_9EUKA|nr:Conserved hypothetical protein [Hexamita inflata]